jgi:hypothetical protein
MSTAQNITIVLIKGVIPKGSIALIAGYDRMLAIINSTFGSKLNTRSKPASASGSDAS